MRTHPKCPDPSCLNGERMVLSSHGHTFATCEFCETHVTQAEWAQILTVITPGRWLHSGWCHDCDGTECGNHPHMGSFGGPGWDIAPTAPPPRPCPNGRICEAVWDHGPNGSCTHTGTHTIGGASGWSTIVCHDHAVTMARDEIRAGGDIVVTPIGEQYLDDEW